MADLGNIFAPGGARFSVANSYAKRFEAFLADLEAAGYKVKGDQSGGYNYRNIAGTNRLSRHALGEAIDVNWTDNPRGGQGNIPADLARSLARKHGLSWGGDWRNPDPMHFEVAAGGAWSGAGSNRPKWPLTSRDIGAQPQPQQPQLQPQQMLPGEPVPDTGGMPVTASAPQGGQGGGAGPKMADPTYAGYAGMSPEDIARNRKIAEMLASQATDASPVGHWTQALARALQGGIAGMYEGRASKGERERRDYIAKALASDPSMANLSPGMRAVIAQNPDMMTAVAGKVVGNALDPNAGLNRRLLEAKVKSAENPSTDDIREFEYAKARGYPGSLQDWMTLKRTKAGGDYAKQLVYGTDAQGNVIPMQAGSQGDLVASKLPPGVKLQRDPIRMDAGDRYILLDPTTRQPIGQVPKNLAEAERQKEVGQARGKAQIDLPGVESSARNIFNYIDSVASDPYLDSMIGPVQGRMPNITTSARTLQSKIDQLNSQGFLIAFQSLKGAGAITEREGEAATRALTRLREMVQSGKDYRQALKDFRSEVQRMVEVARSRAGAGTQGNSGGGSGFGGGQETKSIGGKTYIKMNGQWYEQ